MKSRALTLAAAALASVILLVGPGSASTATRKPPKSCVKALDAAEDLRAESQSLIQSIAGFFHQVSVNASTNSTNVQAFVEQLTSDTQSLTTIFTTETPKVAEINTRLSTYAARCRAGR